MLYQGIHYDIDDTTYHADPCPKPSLSTSMAKVFWQETSKHAWLDHPRLNPDFEPTNKRQFDLGSAAHAALLGTIMRFVIIDADDYRKKATQQQRDEAYEQGRIPILEREVDAVLEMVGVSKRFIDDTELRGIFDNGKPEVTVIEFSDGIWKRCRIDWLPDNREIILDYKSTGGSSKPETWIRTQLFNMHYDIQAFSYPHILSKVEGIPAPRFVWLVQENKPPYACSLIGASPSVLESGKKKWRYACHKWQWCIEHNKWPAHDSRIHWAEPMPWHMAEVEQRGNS